MNHANHKWLGCEKMSDKNGGENKKNNDGQEKEDEEKLRRERPTQELNRSTEMPNRGTELHRETSAWDGKDSNDFIVMDTTKKLGNRYRLQELLAEDTGQAYLYLCTDDENHQYVAKIYKKDKRPKSEIIEFMLATSNPSLIKILVNGEFEGRYFEIMPYYRQGDLSRHAPLDAKVIREVVIPSVVSGLKELHEKKIVHRDMKPSNLFFSDDLQRVVIGDLGISTKLSPGQIVRATKQHMTLGYAAPELLSLNDLSFVSKETDYYALGISLWHLAIGLDPFQGMTNDQIIIMTSTFKLPLPESMDPQLLQLIRGLTVKDRNHRWGCDEIQKWLDGESVAVLDSMDSVKSIPEYKFAGQSFSDLRILASAMSDNWIEAKSHLYRGVLSGFFQTVRPDLYATLADIADEPGNQNFGLFRALFVLDSSLPFVWHGGIQFESVQELGKAMMKSLPDAKTEFVEIVATGAVSWFMERKKFKDINLITHVKSIEKRVVTEPVLSLYNMAMTLTGAKEYILENNTLRSIKELVQCLEEQPSKRNEWSDDLIHDPLFFAWLEQLGYREQIGLWKSIPYDDPFIMDPMRKLQTLLKGIYANHDVIDNLANGRPKRSFIRIDQAHDAKLLMKFMRRIPEEDQANFEKRVGVYIEELPLLQIGTVRLQKDDYDTVCKKIRFSLESRMSLIYENVNLIDYCKELSNVVLYYDDISEDAFNKWLNRQGEGAPLLVRFNWSKTRENTTVKYLKSVVSTSNAEQSYEVRWKLTKDVDK